MSWLEGDTTRPALVRATSVGTPAPSHGRETSSDAGEQRPYGNERPSYVEETGGYAVEMAVEAIKTPL